MYSHICLGTNDVERSFPFYEALCAELGLRLRFKDQESGGAAWQPADADRPLLFLTKPFDGAPATPGNGQMVAFLAASRAIVDRAHAAAVAAGGQCEGPPGLRPHYHPDYYGAYVRDPEGNKLCICCHGTE